jgi:uncharacterized membrane protein
MALKIFKYSNYFTRVINESKRLQTKKILQQFLESNLTRKPFNLLKLIISKCIFIGRATDAFSFCWLFIIEAPQGSALAPLLFTFSM